MVSHLSSPGTRKHSNNPHTLRQTGTVQWLTLPPLTSSVSAQAIWPKNSWCAKKVKQMLFFNCSRNNQITEIRQKWKLVTSSLDSVNPTQIVSLQLTKIYSMRCFAQIVVGGWRMAAEMCVFNRLRELKDKTRTTESWTQQVKGFSSQHSLKKKKKLVKEETFLCEIIFMIFFFPFWSVQFYVNKTHTHTRSHRAKYSNFVQLSDYAQAAGWKWRQLVWFDMRSLFTGYTPSL